MTFFIIFKTLSKLHSRQTLASGPCSYSGIARHGLVVTDRSLKASLNVSRETNLESIEDIKSWKRVWVTAVGLSRITALALVVFFGALGVNASSAFAEVPWWQMSSSSTPTNLPPGGEGQIVVAATNLGDAPVEGSVEPVRITDTLPPGLTATEISGGTSPFSFFSLHGPVECTQPAGPCVFEGTLPPYEQLSVIITVKVSVDAQPSGENEAKIIGGGAQSVSIGRPVVVSGAATTFGVGEYELSPENADGSLDTQSGSHPFQLTTTIGLDQTLESNAQLGSIPTLPALAKDLQFNLPPGLVGNPTPLPRCTDKEFTELNEHGVTLCPPDTVVGAASVTINEPALGVLTLPAPVFNTGALAR